MIEVILLLYWLYDNCRFCRKILAYRENITDLFHTSNTITSKVLRFNKTSSILVCLKTLSC